MASRNSATIKYDQSGNELWVVPCENCQINALALDASGNVYVTGVKPPENFGLESPKNYATIKYDPEGNELWFAQYNGPDNMGDEAKALTVDAAGNVYVTGYINYHPYYLGMPRTTYDDIATIKYDPEGNELWVYHYNGPDADQDRSKAIAVDAAGNVYILGGSMGATSEGSVLIKLSSDSSSGGGGGGAGGGSGVCFIGTIAP